MTLHGAAARAALLGVLALSSIRPAAALGSSPRVSSVSSYGATGDGVTDDTDAIQAAVDGLRAGHTLVFPTGTYRIRSTQGIRLKDDVRLDLGGATLMGDNVRGARCRLIDIQGRRGIVITGGTLVGSRVGAPEWGVGIFASDADNLLIDGVTLRDFFFDGILLTGNRGCRKVTIRRVVAHNNRRTGLAIPAGEDILVEDSTFSGTRGQSPEAGLNIEPNSAGIVRNARIIRSTFRDNAGVGLYIHRGKGVEVSGVSVEKCVSEGNALGIVASAVENVSILECRVTGHRGRAKSGIAIGDNATSVVVAGNQLEGNHRGIISAGASKVTIRGNHVTGLGPPYASAAAEDADGIVCRGLKALLDGACAITGNVVRATAGAGILTHLVSGVAVSDNTIAETGRRGIHLVSTTSSEVRENRVADYSLELAGRFAAIELADSSNDNLVANNVVRGTGQKSSPVMIGPGCRGNQVFGNVSGSASGLTNGRGDSTP